MPEAGWLLLLLFLGCCSLLVVAILWPSFRRAPSQAGTANQSVDEASAFTSATTLATQPETTTAVQKTKRDATALLVTPPTLSPCEWLSIVNERQDDAPHTLIVGTSGSGKTTLAQAVIAARSGYLCILDPKCKPGRWGGLPAIPIDDDGRYTQIEEAIKALLGELNARLVSLKQGTTTFADLTIVAEELPTLISECPSAATLFKQVGRMGRELRMRLLGLSQSERVKSLGISGEGDAIDNYTLIRLGKAAIAVLPEARVMERPAVLEWRGSYHLIDVRDVLGLTRRVIHRSRSWGLGTPESGTFKQTQQHTEGGNG